MRMKNKLCALLLFMAVSSTGHAESNLVLAPLTAPPKSGSEVFFDVSKGEVRIDGEVIREFAVNRERVSVSYKNTTAKELAPKYTLRIYNRYGILLGVDEVKSSMLGGSPHLKPGDIGGDKLHVEWFDMKALFRHSLIQELPQDFDRARWLSIEGSNSKIEGNDRE